MTGPRPAAVTLPCRAGQPGDGQHRAAPDEDLDGDLARAVALLDGVAADDLLDGDQAVELPMAFVECGQA